MCSVGFCCSNGRQGQQNTMCCLWILYTCGLLEGSSNYTVCFRYTTVNIFNQLIQGEFSESGPSHYQQEVTTFPPLWLPLPLWERIKVKKAKTNRVIKMKMNLKKESCCLLRIGKNMHREWVRGKQCHLMISGGYAILEES